MVSKIFKELPMSELHEQLAHTQNPYAAHTLLAERLADAVIVEAFKDGQLDSKTLAVMQEPDGREFVQRTYNPGAELGFEHELYSPKLPFAESLVVMQCMYEEVGIRVVPSSLLPHREGEPVTVVSDYLPNAVQYKQASLEAKQEAVQGLASLLDPKSKYLPGAQAIMSDLFVYDIGEDGQQHPLVVDVDPHIICKPDVSDYFSASSTDVIISFYINQINVLIESEWANDSSEKAALYLAFLQKLVSISDGSIFNGDRASEAIFAMHSNQQMAQLGLDSRQAIGDSGWEQF